jgi:hypothetical protein
MRHVEAVLEVHRHTRPHIVEGAAPNP